MQERLSIQSEINMVIETEQNIIYHLRYILNEREKIVQICKRKIIEAQKNMGNNSTEIS